MRDPRYYQIAALSSLILYGCLSLDMHTSVSIVAVIILTALLTQFLFTRLLSLPYFEPRSALISSLSLSLLLRTNSYTLACLAAFIAISSKFAIRFRGKHIFNPTNFAIVVLLLLTDDVWVSPGQWSNATFFCFLAACLGLIVIFRTRRSDISIAFLVFYAAILFGRAIWLGDPLAIPLHQLQSGTLLIFSFFMITDPMTTPNSRMGRILFAGLVAGTVAAFQFIFYETNGVLYGLVICCMSVSLIDHYLPDKRYQWHNRNNNSRPVTKNLSNSHDLKGARI